MFDPNKQVNPSLFSIFLRILYFEFVEAQKAFSKEMIIFAFDCYLQMVELY